MEGNLCSGMGRGCRGRVYSLLGEGRGRRRRELCGEWDFLLSVCGLQYYMHLLDVSWSELLSTCSERER